VAPVELHNALMAVTHCDDKPLKCAVISEHNTPMSYNLQIHERKSRWSVKKTYEENSETHKHIDFTVIETHKIFEEIFPNSLTNSWR
jgi:hypothetical protein